MGRRSVEDVSPVRRGDVDGNDKLRAGPPPAVFSVEPRDRLACDWMTRDMLAAAAAAFFALVEERRRQLDGTVRPEWEVDVYVFALQECSRQAA